jgi:hypothetical protein
MLLMGGCDSCFLNARRPLNKSSNMWFRAHIRNEWGPSESTNRIWTEPSSSSRDELELRIEMQTGDVIRERCRTLTLPPATDEPPGMKSRLRRRQPGTAS